MKSLRLLFLATAVPAVLTNVAWARAVRLWSYQELFDKSDLVVIGTPATNKDNKERADLPGFSGEQVISVETKFSVSIVLKGNKALSDLILDHYRTSDGTNIPHVPNGPSFVSFASAEGPSAGHRTYILFLLRQADGHYAPVVGQWDPGLGIKELVAAGG